MVDLSELNSILDITKRAVDDLLRLERTSDILLTHHNEVQLQFALASTLSRSGHAVLWEQRHQRDDEESGRIDLSAWSERRTEKPVENAWIEIKRTGLRWDNAPGNRLAGIFENDFHKLKALNKRDWQQIHHGYWVWLHLIKDYGTELRQTRPTKRRWTSRTDLKKLALRLPRIEGEQATLGRTLMDIDSQSCEAVCSMLPYLLSRRTDYSALVVVARLR